MSELDTASRTKYQSDELRQINSFDDAIALIQLQQEAIPDAKDLIGDGFELVATNDKGRLIGIPFVVLDWSFSPSTDFEGREFVTVRIVTESGAKLILNDGSTGVYAQLRSITDTHEFNPAFRVRKGLRVSEYEYENPNGTKARARTFYLATN
jgi:hypothetical protein